MKMLKTYGKVGGFIWITLSRIYVRKLGRNNRVNLINILCKPKEGKARK